MWIIKIFTIQCFYPTRIQNEHWCIYCYLQIPPRENWFQYVRRVNATSIYFPCITFLYGWDFREDCSEFIQSIFSTTVYRVIHKEWDFREDSSEFIQSIFSTTVYRVIHKEWDFRDDCTTFLLSDFLHVRFSATCLFCCLSLDIP